MLKAILLGQNDIITGKASKKRSYDYRDVVDVVREYDPTGRKTSIHKEGYKVVIKVKHPKTAYNLANILEDEGFELLDLEDFDTTINVRLH